MHKVGILLPTYNSAEFIEQQIYSIFAQKQIDVTLFIYDDCSTDNTVSLVNELKNFFPIHFLPSTTGFGNASGSFFYLISIVNDIILNYDYWALADHDDIWSPYKIISAIEKLNSNNYSCYSSLFIPLKHNILDGFVSFFNNNKKSNIKSLDYLFESPGPGCTFVFKNKFFKNLSNFVKSNIDKMSEIFWHDWFIYMFARFNKYNWTIDERSYILYLQHGANETGVNLGYNAAVKRLKALLSGQFLTQSKLMISVIDPNTELSIRISRFNFKDRVWFLIRFYKLRRSMVDSLVVLLCIILNPFSSNITNKKFSSI